MATGVLSAGRECYGFSKTWSVRTEMQRAARTARGVVDDSAVSAVIDYRRRDEIRRDYILRLGRG